MSEHKSLLAAVLAFQAEMPTLKKSASNPHYKSRFAPLDEIVEVVTPLLYKHGLTWMTFPSANDAGASTLDYELGHPASGEVKAGRMPLLLDKQNAQGQGSAITYARRYAITAVLNLVADEDDDGNGASASNAAARSTAPRAATPAQLKRLRGDITRNNLNADAMAALLGSIGVVPAQGETINKVVTRLTADQASALIDTISQGAVKVGGSDVPADGEFTHPAEPDALPLDDERAQTDTRAELHG